MCYVQVAEGELVAWCRGNLAQYKVPAQVHPRESMPMTGSGKILKTALRAEYGLRAVKASQPGIPCPQIWRGSGWPTCIYVQCHALTAGKSHHCKTSCFVVQMQSGGEVAPSFSSLSEFPASCNLVNTDSSFSAYQSARHSWALSSCLNISIEVPMH